MTVRGFVAHASVEVEPDGAIVVATTVGFPEPVGATLDLPALLVAGQQARVRQGAGGVVSAWSATVVVRDHTADCPAGPPRPQVDPAPPLTCGSRTGVENLLGGANVWITADGTETGRVDGCATPQHGVTVNPFDTLGQRVRTHTELCRDLAPPSLEHLVQPWPSPLPVPGFAPVYAGGEQLQVTGIANGARVFVTLGGAPLGTFRCWGLAPPRGSRRCSVPGRRSARRSSCARARPSGCSAISCRSAWAAPRPCT